MKLFTCRTGKFLRGTVLITVVFFFINATLLSLKFGRQRLRTSEGTGNQSSVAHSPLSDKVLERNTYWNQTLVFDSPFPAKILYRNTYWQVHRSFVNLSICQGDKNASPKSKGCPLNKNNNNNKNLSHYEEVVAYSSFYDDRSTPASPRWVQVLAVIKMVPKPSPIYCQIWLRENSTLTNGSLIMAFLKSQGKTDKSLEMSLSRVDLNGSDFHDVENPPTWMFEFQSVSHTTGRNHNFGNLSYGQRQFACPMKGVHPSLVPTHVSLTFKRNERSTILLPVQYPDEKKLSTVDDGKNKTEQINNNNNIINNNNRSPYKHEFVVCVTQVSPYNGQRKACCCIIDYRLIFLWKYKRPQMLHFLVLFRIIERLIAMNYKRLIFFATIKF